MKVLMVNNGIFPQIVGGTEIYVDSLAKELGKLSVDIYIAYISYKNMLFKSNIILDKNNNSNTTVYKVVLPKWTLIKSIFKHGVSLGLYLNDMLPNIFKELIKKINPDIIHFHNISWWRNVKILTIPKKSNIPTILTLHDYWFLCPLSILLYYEKYPCTGPNPHKCRNCWINAVSHNNTLIKNILFNLVNDNQFYLRHHIWLSCINETNLVIAPSKFLRKIFIKYGIPQDKIVYSENGYNLDIFKKFRKKEKDTDKIIFGFVGGIARHKGVHVLVDAFIDIPEDKAELRIYGSYNPNSKYIKELLGKIKGKRNIKFMGRFEDVKDPYSEIDVLVFPSIWYENCPLVLAEARATKTPVIASNLGAIPEFVKDGKTGLLFEPGNSKDLYEKIIQIIENPKLIEEFKQNITPPKSIKEQAKEIEKIYSLILEGRING